MRQANRAARWLALTRHALSLVAALAILLVGALGTSATARAEELIKDFTSDVTVKPSGTLVVTEKIRVRAEGYDIRRGIFRDFPLLVNHGSHLESVTFDILSVQRDGHSESYHTKDIDGGIRIYIGDADTRLRDGDHTYTLTYATKGWMRYFDDHDEVFWNATGNFWAFRILNARSIIRLPDGAKSQNVVFYTGGYGDTGSKASLVQDGNMVVVDTTEPLGDHQGLSVAVKIRKGIVAPPTFMDHLQGIARAYKAHVIALAVILVVLGYYFLMWRKVGVDPKPGVIVPRWTPPEGLSPALVLYITNRGFGSKRFQAIAATVVDLAVKGFVTVDKPEAGMEIKRTDKRTDRSLPAGQKALLAKLKSLSGEKITIDKAHGSSVKNMVQKVVDAVTKEHENEFFRSNLGALVLGILLSIIGIIIFVVMDPTVLVALFAMLCLSMIAFFFKNTLSGIFSEKMGVINLITLVVFGFIGLQVLLTIGSVALGAVLQSLFNFSAASSGLYLGTIGLMAVNVVFFFIMGAPTPAGRKKMDEIEGLKQYLTLAEADRMNMTDAPTMSPQHFETLLPYAMALGVEKPWSENFSAWLATAAGAAAAASYTPLWYHAPYHGGTSIADSFGDISSFMASTMQSSMPTPSSSSSSGFSSGGGGGGGFSGGGGGGGGGGGW